MTLVCGVPFFWLVGSQVGEDVVRVTFVHSNTHKMATEQHYTLKVKTIFNTVILTSDVG